MILLSKEPQIFFFPVNDNEPQTDVSKELITFSDHFILLCCSYYWVLGCDL